MRFRKYFSAAIIVSGTLLGLGIYIQEKQDTEMNCLPRNPYGEGGYEQHLSVEAGNREEKIKIFVEEEHYKEQEVLEYIQGAKEELEQWYEGQTKGTGEIQKDMKFPEQIENNPVMLSWSTGWPDVLSWEGRIGENVSEQGEKTELYCTISLENHEEVWTKEVTVFPLVLSESQELEKKIQKKAEEISHEEGKKLLLPETIDGETVHYKKDKDYKGPLVCILSLLLGLGAEPLAREKEKQKEEKKRKEMQADYPDIVEKLVLFLRAGFSIRRAMEKLATGYLRNRDKYHLGERAAYEEVVKTCREMEGGMYEAEAYERMGKRYGISQYKMLSVLLVQNLRRGNENLLELLEREAASVTEERKRSARVKGEEAAIKLLLPMVMQLVVVLIILMVPAFLSFM